MAAKRKPKKRKLAAKKPAPKKRKLAAKKPAPKKRKPTAKKPAPKKRKPRSPKKPPVKRKKVVHRQPLARKISIIVTKGRAEQRESSVKAISAMRPAVEMLGAITDIAGYMIQAEFFQPMDPEEVIPSLMENSRPFTLEAPLVLSIGVSLTNGKFQILAFKNARTLEEAFLEFDTHRHEYEEKRYA